MLTWFKSNVAYTIRIHGFITQVLSSLKSYFSSLFTTKRKLNMISHFQHTSQFRCQLHWENWQFPSQDISATNCMIFFTSCFRKRCKGLATFCVFLEKNLNKCLNHCLPLIGICLQILFWLLFIRLTKHEGASLGVEHPLGSWSAHNPLQLYDNHACNKASS